MSDKPGILQNWDPFRVASIVLLAFYVVASVSWAMMHPAHLLWVCDIAVLIMAISFWRRSSLLLTSQFTAVGVIYLVWNVDFWSGFFFDYLPLGLTAYMFQFHHSFAEKCISLAMHVFVLPVAFWGVFVLGVARRGWLLQSAFTAVIGVLTLALTPWSMRINWIFASLFPDPSALLYLFYFMCFIFVMPFLIYGPTNVALTWIVRGCRAASGYPRGVSTESPIEVSKTWTAQIFRRFSAPVTLLSLGMLMLITVVVCGNADRRFSLASAGVQVDGQFGSELATLPSIPIETTLDELLASEDRSQSIAIHAWPEADLPVEPGAGGAKAHVNWREVVQRVGIANIPTAPEYVVIKGRRQTSGSVVWLCVFDETLRFARYCDIFGHRDTFEVWCRLEVAGKTIEHAAKGAAEGADAGDAELPGDYAVFGLAVLELRDGKCLSRSPICLVRRPCSGVSRLDED